MERIALYLASVRRHVSLGKDLNGRELGPGFGQRKNGQYYARFENRFGTRKTLYSMDLQN